MAIHSTDQGTASGVKVRRINMSRRSAPCPQCGAEGKRHSTGTRRLNDIGIGGPTVLEVMYSKHYCPVCQKHFTVAMDHLALPSTRFTNRVRQTAVRMVLAEKVTLHRASTRMREKYCVKVPLSTLHDWVVETDEVPPAVSLETAEPLGIEVTPAPEPAASGDL